MDINITGRNIHLDEGLKKYIHKKLDKLEHLHSRIYSCSVVLEEERERKNVEIILGLKKNRVVAKESSVDFLASVDLAYDSVKKQIRRLSGRVGDKRRRSMLGRIINPSGIFGRPADNESGQAGDIIKSNMFADKPMLPEEAKLELDIMERDFLMFKNADTGDVNVIYHMKNGKYGLIEPEF